MEPGGVAQVGFTVIPVLIGVAFVVIVGLIVYRAVRLARQGVNPLTVDQDLAARVLRSQALAPTRTKGERLAELDRLLADGTISAEERAAARDRILSE